MSACFPWLWNKALFQIEGSIAAVLSDQYWPVTYDGKSVLVGWFYWTITRCEPDCPRSFLEWPRYLRLFSLVFFGRRMHLVLQWLPSQPTEGWEETLEKTCGNTLVQSGKCCVSKYRLQPLANAHPLLSVVLVISRLCSPCLADMPTCRLQGSPVVTPTLYWGCSAAWNSAPNPSPKVTPKVSANANATQT